MKLSVMIITFNHEQFIARAIDSVLAQQVNFDYEIVIGEDCSRDRTRIIVEGFRRRYPDRIVPLFRNENIGAARNAEETLAACRGEYIALLEGDDYWICDQKLQRQVEFLDCHPGSSMCCHRVQFLVETGVAKFDIYPLLPAGPYRIEDILKVNFVVTCSAMLRRSSVFFLPPWFRKMRMTDWPMFALAARNGTIELMDEVMAAYRVHAGGSWSSLPSSARLNETSRMLKALDRHLKFQYTDTIREVIARPYLNLAASARLNGQRTEAAKHLAKCIWNGGWHLPGSQRALLGLAAYILMGSWYKVFSTARQSN